VKWCRLYSEIIDDPKMAKLTDSQFRHFVLLLALATEQEKDGSIDMEPEDVAWRLRVEVDALCDTMARLKELKIFDNGYENPVFINWPKRQFRSDDSSERVKRYRAKQAKRDVTVTVTPRARAETETETETEKDKDDNKTDVLSATFVEIPLRKDEKYELTDIQVQEYEATYPGLDVRQEIKKLKKWNQDNPPKRKTKAGILRHVNSWLSREADKLEAQKTFKDTFRPKEIPKRESRAQTENKLRQQAKKLREKP
jgi:hypothetical protein